MLQRDVTPMTRGDGCRAFESLPKITIRLMLCTSFTQLPIVYNCHAPGQLVVCCNDSDGAAMAHRSFFALPSKSIAHSNPQPDLEEEEPSFERGDQRLLLVLLLAGEGLSQAEQQRLRITAPLVPVRLEEHLGDLHVDGKAFLIRLLPYRTVLPVASLCCRQRALHGCSNIHSALSFGLGAVKLGRSQSWLRRQF